MMKQYIKYTASGFAGAIANFMIYNLLLRAFSGWSWNYYYLLAQTVSYFASIVVTFLLCRGFVFNSPSERSVPWLWALLRMTLVYSFTGIVVNSLLSLLWVQVLGISKEWVSILNDVSAGPVNYILNKFWSFGKNKKKVH